MNLGFQKTRVALTASFLLIGFVGAIFFWVAQTESDAQAAKSRLTLSDIPFDGARAYDYLKQLEAIGPRRSGSPGMAKQQALITDHFIRLGAKVYRQPFTVRDPQNQKPVEMVNLIVRFNPEINDRILLCAHYDTLPLPMLDPHNPKGTFVGANDGASGVALLMELGNRMKEMPSSLGVDMVFFDGEEYIFSIRDRFFLGSEYFARSYAKRKSNFRYRWAILLDMIGDADLQIYQERNSRSWSDSRPLVDQIWATARRLGVKEFIARPKHSIQDDHIMLHNVGKIPSCDIIDFDYPPWHTEADRSDQCSALSLAKVGWVVIEWLREYVANDRDGLKKY
jgi:Peptidase family M28